jgi:hypothetical protein
MSLTVMSPRRCPPSSTTGSFSMRWRPMIASASSSVVPLGAVTSPSLVIASRSGRSRARSNCRSRLVMIPTSRPSSSTTGTPEILKRDMSCTASRSVASGERVIGFMIIPLSERFTRSTSAGLPVDRHVLVQHADAAGAGHGDGHLALGHRVHRRRHERHVEGDAAREAAGGAHVLRVHLRVAGREEHVVEGERHGLAHAGGAVRRGRAAGLCAVRRSRPVRGGDPPNAKPRRPVVGVGVVGRGWGAGRSGGNRGRHGET